MKKLILLIIILTIPFVVFARDENIGYYNGNRNWPIIRIHMGFATYMDKSSLVVHKNDAQGFEFAFNTILVNYNTENPSIVGHDTMWIYKPWNEPDIAYAKYKGNEQWYRFSLKDLRTPNEINRIGFFLGWKVATGTNYRTDS